MEDSVVKKRPPPPLKPKPKVDRSRVLNPSASCGQFNDTSLQTSGRNAPVRTRPQRPPLPKNYPSQPARRSQSSMSKQLSVPLDSGEMPSAEEIAPIPPPRRRRRRYRSEPSQETVSPSHSSLSGIDGNHSPRGSLAELNAAPELPPRGASISRQHHTSATLPSSSRTMTTSTAGTSASSEHVQQLKARSYTTSLPKPASVKGFGSASLPRVATYRNDDTATMPRMSKGRSCSLTGELQSVISQQVESGVHAVVRHVDFEQAGFKRPLGAPPPATEPATDLYEPVNPKDPFEEEEEEGNGVYEPVKQYDEENEYEGENEYEEEPHNHASTQKSSVAIRTRLLGQPTPFLGQCIPSLGMKMPALKKTTPTLAQPISVPERPTSPKSPRSSSPPPPLPPRNAPQPSQTTTPSLPPRSTPQPSHTTTPSLPPRNTPQPSHDAIPPLPPRNPGVPSHRNIKGTRPQSGLPSSFSQPVLLPPPLEEKLELREEDEQCDNEYMDMDDRNQLEEYVVPQTDTPLQRIPSPNLLPDETGTYELVNTHRPVPPPRRDSKLLFGHLSVSNKNQSPVGSSSYVMLQKAAT